MLHQIIEEMEEADLLDKETTSVVKKGAIITISSVMLLGGTTLAAAGIVSFANLFRNKPEISQEKKDNCSYKKGIL